MEGGYRERTLGGRKQKVGNSGCKKRIKGAGKRGLIQREGYRGGGYRKTRIQYYLRSWKHREDTER